MVTYINGFLYHCQHRLEPEEGHTYHWWYDPQSMRTCHTTSRGASMVLDADTVNTPAEASGGRPWDMVVGNVVVLLM